MPGKKRAGRDQRGAVADEASDAVDARSLEGFGQAHCRQDGGEAVREPQGPGDHR